MMGYTMNDLIEALQICAKYETPEWPTNCEHDILTICVDNTKFSEEDIKRLDELGFFVGEGGGFASYRFGSC
jgi:hypothetical protein